MSYTHLSVYHYFEETRNVSAINKSSKKVNKTVNNFYKKRKFDINKFNLIKKNVI